MTVIPIPFVVPIATSGFNNSADERIIHILCHKKSNVDSYSLQLKL